MGGEIRMEPIVFVDTETTGLDPDHNELWEIALIEADGTEHVWAMPPKWLSEADPGALRVNRFYERTSASNWHWSPETRSTIASQIAILTANKHLVGAVPWFDARFLSRLLVEYGVRESWHYHMIDVETLAIGCLATRKMEGVWVPPNLSIVPPWSTTDLAKAIGIDVGDHQFEKHTALGDARWAKAIYERVMGSPR